MGARRRIFQGITANGFGQAITLLIQVASVPILIRAWGVELYGEWVILSAVPSYLTLSDVGFTTVAGNVLALLDAERDRDRMRAVYQSAWAMVSALSFAVLVPVVAVLWLTEPSKLLGLVHITGRTLDVTLIVLFLHVAMSMQTGILQLPFRALKENPLAVAIVNFIRLLEWSAATLTVLLDGAVVHVALAFLLARVLGNVVLWLLLARRSRSLRLGVRHVSARIVKSLLRPSLAAMCFPVGLSLTMQGVVLLIGNLIGPSGVALFSVYRTFTRAPIQLATTINQAVWPELSYAFGARDVAKARALVVKMLKFGATLSAVAALFVYVAGERVIDWWTARPLEHSPRLLTALTLTALVHIVWQPFWVAQIAVNRHTRFALWFLLISALSLAPAMFLLSSFDLNGAGYAALLSECLLAGAALATFTRYFDRARA